jgi:hypothetical protein
MSLPLKLTKYLENEEDFLPWFFAAHGVRFLDNKRNTTEFGLFKVEKK